MESGRAAAIGERPARRHAAHSLAVIQCFDAQSKVRSILSLLHFVSICMLLRLRVNFIWTAQPVSHGGKQVHRVARRFVIAISDRILDMARPPPHHPVGFAIHQARFVSCVATGSAACEHTTREQARQALGASHGRVAVLWLMQAIPGGLESLIDAVASSHREPSWSSQAGSASIINA
jgi:hypothetical protein